LTWKTIVKRALAIAVAGAALYLVLPALIKVLGEWPRLSTLNPAWFTVCLAAELFSFICTFALQRRGDVDLVAGDHGGVAVDAGGGGHVRGFAQLVWWVRM